MKEGVDFVWHPMTPAQFAQYIRDSFQEYLAAARRVLDETYGDLRGYLAAAGVGLAQTVSSKPAPNVATHDGQTRVGTRLEVPGYEADDVIARLRKITEYETSHFHQR